MPKANVAVTSPSHFLQNYLYLFCTDPETEINHSRLYKHYLTDDEIGYTENHFKAYILAFTTSEQTLDIDFIYKLHSQIGSHLPTAGRCKMGSNVFAVLGREIPKKVTQATATKNGLKEFIEQWIINNTENTHMLVISPIGAIDNPNYQGSRVGTKLLWQKNNKVELRQITDKGSFCTIYRHEQHLELLWSAMNDPQFTAEVNSMPDDLVDPTNILATSETKLKKLLQKYNLEIGSCTTNIEKISCIAQLAIGINQLHHFSDANTRLSVLLLNYLLDRNNLSFTIIANPNRLSMFSVIELVQSIIEGQTYFKNLCQGRVPVINDAYVKNKNYQFQPQPVICSKEVVRLFIDEVILSNYSKLCNSLPQFYSLSYSQSLFHKIEPSEQRKTVLINSTPKILNFDDIPTDSDLITFDPCFS